MRVLWLAPVLLSVVLGCGGKKDPTPAATKPNVTTPTPPKPPETPTSVSQPAAVSQPTSASQPASAPAPLNPTLVLPTTPAPEVELIEYEAWFGVKDFPALSADGLVVAAFYAQGYDERDNVGDTVSLILYNTADYKIKERIDLLLPDETYSENETALKKTRASLLKKVAPRVEAAQKLLAANKWLPLEVLASLDEGSWGRESDPKALKIEVNAETLQISAWVGGRQVSDKKYPELKAPAAPPCKDEDFQPGCGCDYPLIVDGVLYNAEARIFLVSLQHVIDHQCEQPPPNPTVSIRYDAPQESIQR